MVSLPVCDVPREDDLARGLRCCCVLQSLLWAAVKVGERTTRNLLEYMAPVLNPDKELESSAGGESRRRVWLS